jgi:hypothetical protein
MHLLAGYAVLSMVAVRLAVGWAGWLRPANGARRPRWLDWQATGLLTVIALTGASGEANVAVMNLVVPRQSAMAPEALSFALFLSNAANQLAFAEEARVLPSSRGALASLEGRLRAAVHRCWGRSRSPVSSTRLACSPLART